MDYTREITDRKICVLGKDEALRKYMTERLAELKFINVSNAEDIDEAVLSAEAILIVDDGKAGYDLVKACAGAAKNVLWVAPSYLDKADYKKLEEFSDLVKIGFLRRYDYLYENFKSKVDNFLVFKKMLSGNCGVRIPLVSVYGEKHPMKEDLIFRLLDGFSFMLGEDIVKTELKDSSAKEGLGDRFIAEVTTEKGVNIEITVDTGDFESQENFEILMERGKFQFFAPINEERIYKDYIGVYHMLEEWEKVLTGGKTENLAEVCDAVAIVNAVGFLLGK